MSDKPKSHNVIAKSFNYSLPLTHYAINLLVNCQKGGENKWP